MFTLLIQSVFPRSGLALWEENPKQPNAGGYVFSQPVMLEWDSKKDELQTLLPNLELLLNKEGAWWQDVEKIVIVVGVGNFSSTRISVTIANMLSLLTKAELLEVELKEAMPISELVKSVKADIEKGKLKAVNLAKPVYKAEPVISKSNKKKF